MKRIALALIAAISLTGCSLHAATRPSYGGTLRISVQAVPTSLDPADPIMSGTHSGQQICRAIFDTLVRLDGKGVAQPDLAIRWESDAGEQRWRIWLRDGVRFDDDSPLTSAVVASSLRFSNPRWQVSVDGDQVVIETGFPEPQLPYELALTRNSIAKRDGTIRGTGPFVISEWNPGKVLAMIARENYWAGRAFLNSVVITFGQSYRDQLLAFELDKADAIELSPQKANRASADRQRVENSRPMVLIALVFAQPPRSAGETQRRQMLAHCLDRASVNTVLLQGSGEPAAGLLPNWITGYEFLFASGSGNGGSLNRTDTSTTRWSFSYDASDPALRVIAERVILNARDAGIALDKSGNRPADLRLVEAPIESLQGETALQQLAQRLGLPSPVFQSNGPAEAYSIENEFITSARVIPLIHFPYFYGLAKETHNWDAVRDGNWHLEDVWREVPAP